MLSHVNIGDGLVVSVMDGIDCVSFLRNGLWLYIIAAIGLPNRSVTRDCGKSCLRHSSMSRNTERNSRNEILVIFKLKITWLWLGLIFVMLQIVYLAAKNWTAREDRVFVQITQSMKYIDPSQSDAMFLLVVIWIFKLKISTCQARDQGSSWIRDVGSRCIWNHWESCKNLQAKQERQRTSGRWNLVF